MPTPGVFGRLRLINHNGVGRLLGSCSGGGFALDTGMTFDVTIVGISGNLVSELSSWTLVGAPNYSAVLDIAGENATVFDAWTDPVNCGAAASFAHYTRLIVKSTNLYIVEGYILVETQPGVCEHVRHFLSGALTFGSLEVGDTHRLDNRMGDANLPAKLFTGPAGRMELRRLT